MNASIRKALPKIKRKKQDRDSAEDFSLIMRSRRVLKAWRKMCGDARLPVLITKRYRQ
jgi:hypothetical protein